MSEIAGRVLSTRLFLVLAAAAVVARLLMVWLLPPLLDVYYYDAQAAKALVGGIDPYGLSYLGIPAWLATPDASNVFAYLPGVPAFLASFGAIWDIRLGLVFADVLVGFSIFSMGGKRAKSSALFFLLLPFTALFSTSYPNNSLVSIAFLGLAGMFWAGGRGRLASLATGAALASSQLVWLLYPLFLVWSLRSRRFDEVAIQLGVALLLVLPFALWNWPRFFYDVVVFQFTRAPRAVITQVAFGYNVNLTVDGIVYTLLGVSVPLLLRVAAAVAAVSYAALRSRDLGSVLLNGTWLMTLMVFLLPNDLSLWYLELPLVTFLMWFAGPYRAKAEKLANA